MSLPPGQGPQPPVPARPVSGGVVAGVLVLGLLAGVAGGILGTELTEQVEPRASDPAPRVVEADPVAVAASPVTEIAAMALPSVVYIAVASSGGQGVGSGFVIREDGYVVTNSHVVSGAGENAEIEVSFADGEVVPAEVVGQDPGYDIAVLKVERDGLTPLAFGDSDAVQVGGGVLAVGAPLGLDSTVTAGIVSATERPVVAGGQDRTSYINAIQTDAAINPGNSGGPLLDMQGQVIGVNSAIAQVPGELRGQLGNIGLGFAIPSNQAARTATQIIETGSSEHPVIGVMVDLRHPGPGARVVEEADAEDGSDPVVEDGPADRAGIRPGDVLLMVDGERIDDGDHLIVVLRSKRVGDTVEVLVRSENGRERSVDVVLQASGDAG